MKPNASTKRTYLPPVLLLTVLCLSLQGCAVKPQVQPISPTLPSRPSVTMPPLPNEILNGVQEDLSELEKRRQERVRLLMLSREHGLEPLKTP